MTSLAELEAKLKHPARLASLAAGIGAFIGGAITENKPLGYFLVGVGLTSSAISIVSLFNPIHLEPLQDVDGLSTRHERDVASKGIGQSGSGRTDIPRPEVPPEELAATSMDEYLTGRPETVRTYASDDVETAYQRTTGMALNQTGGPYVGEEYQDAVMSQGVDIAQGRHSTFPNVETRYQRSGGNIVGQTGSYQEGTDYGHALLGSLMPPSGSVHELPLSKKVKPLSGVDQFNKIKFGQNYPGQAIGFRV